MAVLANPSRDRHEAGTGQLRRPWYFAWALGGRSSRRGSAKHGGEDAPNRTLHLTGRAVKVSQSCMFCGPPRR
jgi:hypothetical protein